MELLVYLGELGGFRFLELALFPLENEVRLALASDLDLFLGIRCFLLLLFLFLGFLLGLFALGFSFVRVLSGFVFTVGSLILASFFGLIVPGFLRLGGGLWLVSPYRICE